MPFPNPISFLLRLFGMASDDVKIWTVDEPFVTHQCALGEGPHFESKNNTLRFVDIIRKQIHTVDISKGNGSHKITQLDTPVGITADIEGREDEIIVGAKLGYAIYNKKTDELRYIKTVWGGDKALEEKFRANDGTVDSAGRFYLGMMYDFHSGEPQPEGNLFRLDSDLSLHKIIPNVAIPNGTGWPSSNDVMYFTDSPNASIFAYDFEPESGAISNKRVFFDLKKYYGAEYKGAVPDGLTIDSEDHIWTAIHEGGEVLRISPEGKVVGKVVVPAWKLTCPVFGGDDFDELFITSAGCGPDEEGLPERCTHNGAVFRVKVGIKGKPKNKVKLPADV